MTMQFRNVKAAITTVLGDAEAGRYRTIGHQSQSQDASTVEGNKRSVRVYYSGGDFPKGSSSITGPMDHDILFNIELAVSEPAKADVSVLENALSTPAEKATALSLAREADVLADESWDDLADIIFQVLMDARNIDFSDGTSLSAYEVSNRWVNRIQKDNITRQGELVVITGTIALGLRVEEVVTGGTPVNALEAINTAIGIEDQTPIYEAEANLT